MCALSFEQLIVSRAFRRVVTDGQTGDLGLVKDHGAIGEDQARTPQGKPQTKYTKKTQRNEDL